MKKLSSKENNYAIVVHGGAGKHRDLKRAKKGVKEAVLQGFEILEKGGSALDAVCSAVKCMEDNPYFNAGYGSSLNIEGECELDACLMLGNEYRIGAVAGIKNFRNPILIARRILEKLEHIFLAGEGAEKFAIIEGFKKENLISSERKKIYEKYIKSKKFSKWIKEHPEYLRETVGACALDRDGNIVAGTSTGGIFLKMKGRVGDTPCPGAGTYATPLCSASATGFGEAIMKVCLSKIVCDYIEKGDTPLKACSKGIRELEIKTKKTGGIIAIDIYGNTGFAYNTPHMPCAFIKKGMRKINLIGI